MDRKEAKEYIKQNLSCKEFLTSSPKAGRGMYNCPFCGSGTGRNHTGALKFYEKTNTWYCYRCKEGGDVFNLIEKTYSTDFSGALREGAKRLGIEISSYKPSGSCMSDDNSDINNLYQNKKAALKSSSDGNTAISDFDYTSYYEKCHDFMNVYSDEVTKYLQLRGISMETALNCGVGFDWAADPANVPGADPWSKEKVHPSKRLIIPMGKSSYMGRSIDPNCLKAYAKINSKGSKPGIFNAQELYNGKDTVFVVEGAFDAMSIIEAGGSAIAINSTSNTEILLDMLKERVTESNLAVCFDADFDPNTAETTRKASERLCSGLKTLGINYTLIDLTPFIEDVNGEKDLNDILVREGKDKIRKIIRFASMKFDEIGNFLDKIQTEAYKPYKTGIKFFDDLLGGGIVQQSLLLLMAAPGTGKTALIQQISEQMAINGRKVIYLNFEMSKEQMLARAISGKLEAEGNGMSAMKILQGYNWNENERALICNAVEDYKNKNYKYIRYNPSGVVADLDSILEYLHNMGENSKKSEADAPVVVIDYLHLIGTTRKIDSQELIKQIVSGLKNYAVNYNTSVIGIVATNRASNISGKINLNSGRDSSNIEYSGDYILSLNYYKIDNEDVRADDVNEIAKLQQQKWRQMIVRVVKSRLTAPGKSARCYFNAENNMFYGEDDERLIGNNEIDHFNIPYQQNQKSTLMKIRK